MKSGSTVALGGVVVVRSIGSDTDFASTLFVGVSPEDLALVFEALPPPKKLMIERCGTAAAFAFAFGGILILPTLDKVTSFLRAKISKTDREKGDLI